MSIKNNSNITIEDIHFPAFDGLGRISDNPSDDYLVYPSMSGLLFQDPLDNFDPNWGWGYEMYYPSAYASMQWMAYYGLQPKAGLYLATYDITGQSKYFNFTRTSASSLNATVHHIPEFIAGSSPDIGYPVVVGVFSGDWYDAAQIYRTWAMQQPWVSQGALATRPDIPLWYPALGLRQWIFTHPGDSPDFNMFSILPEVMNDTAAYVGHPAMATWLTMMLPSPISTLWAMWQRLSNFVPAPMRVVR